MARFGWSPFLHAGSAGSQLSQLCAYFTAPALDTLWKYTEGIAIKTNLALH